MISRPYYALLALLFLCACNGIGTAKFAETAPGATASDTNDTGVDNTVNFGGLTSFANKTDSTITLQWTAHANAVSYDIFNGANYLSSVNGQATNQVNLTDLTPSATYNFRVRLRNTIGQNDGNNVVQTVTMNGAPNVPSGITRLTPVAAASNVDSATFQVSGIKAGDTVRLYTDSNCTTQVATGLATDSTIDLTVSGLASAAHKFYSRAIKINPSDCSTVFASYEYRACPDGYLHVEPNTDVGTTAPFCVMKYEARAMSITSGYKTNGCDGAIENCDWNKWAQGIMRSRPVKA